MPAWQLIPVHYQEEINMKYGIVLVGVVAVLGAGCASTVKKVDPASPMLCRAGVNRGLESYYGQQRTADLLTVRGTNMKLLVAGCWVVEGNVRAGDGLTRVRVDG
jgi:hypothetical protein